MHESLQRFLFADNLCLFPSISLQFTFLQPKIAKKIPKTLIFEVHGRLRSLMLTFIRNSSTVLVMISSMSVSVCNHFHARQSNSGK